MSFPHSVLGNAIARRWPSETPLIQHPTNKGGSEDSHHWLPAASFSGDWPNAEPDRGKTFGPPCVKQVPSQQSIARVLSAV